MNNDNVLEVWCVGALEMKKNGVYIPQINTLKI
jgi:hypothetical protein